MLCYSLVSQTNRNVFFLIKYFFRLWSHCSKNALGKSGYYFLRNPGNTVDAPLSIEYRRHNGNFIQIFVLESMLLRLRKETEKDDQRTQPTKFCQVRKLYIFERNINFVFFSANRFTRTRNASFRRSVRTSTRSADSGFAAFSDCSPAYHSDSDLRQDRCFAVLYLK